MLDQWWLVVRHSPDYIDEQGKRWPYPKQGVAIAAFDDEERAKRYAAAGTVGEDRYYVIPVVRKQ